MARKRTLDPDSWTDDKIAELSIGAHLLWIGLISLADDEGRVQWNAKQFKIRLFPAKPKVTPAVVAGLMKEIVAAGAISVYTVAGKEYAAHPKWSKQQYVNRPSPSRFPAPPPGTHGFITESSVSPTELPGMLSEPQVPLVSVSVSDKTNGDDAGASEPTEPDHHTPGPGMQFGVWYAHQAADANAVPAHHLADPMAFAYRQIEASESLLAAHGEPAVKARAEALFAASRAGKLRSHNADIRWLAQFWALPVLDEFAPKKPKVEPDWIKRAREQGMRDEAERTEREKITQEAS